MREEENCEGRRSESGVLEGGFCNNLNNIKLISLDSSVSASATLRFFVVTG